MQDYEFEENRKLKERFVQNWPIPEEYRITDPNEKPYGIIYCIQNKTTGRKYIGSSYAVFTGVKTSRPISSLNKRASQYIHAYNKALRDTASSLKSKRPIIRALVNEGIDNFIMYPLAETTEKNHNYMENLFINKFDTIANGYNCRPAVYAKHQNVGKQTTQYKLARSMGIICVNMNQKKIVRADSMKLFADFMNTTKDMIKNVNRQCLSYKGWFVFYTDKQKRDTLLVDLINNHPRIQFHSPKAIQFYTGLCDSVNQYLTDIVSGHEYFSDFEKLPDITYPDDE